MKIVVGNYIGNQNGSFLDGGGVSDVLVLDSSTIIFDKTSYKFNPNAPSPNLYTPAILWDSASEDVLIFTNLDIHTYFSRPYVIPYYKDLGIDRPIPVGYAPGNPDDPHSRQAGIIIGNRLKTIVEHPHNTSYWIFTAQNDNDYYSFTLNSTGIGSDCSYPQVHRLSDNSYLLASGQQSNDNPGKNAGDSNFANFGADTVVMNGSISSNTFYMWCPPQSRSYTSGWKYFIIVRNPGQLYQDLYVLKTQDFVSIKNWDESVSTNIPLSSSDLSSNYFAFSPGGGINGDSFQPTLAMDADENFYMCAYDEVLADYVLVYILQGQSTFTKIPLGLTDYVGNVDSVTAQGAVTEILPISSNDIRIFVRRNPGGGFAKMYQYRSTDLGVSWTLIGDIFPDINADIGRCRVPHNFCDIPTDKNFLIFASELVATGLEPSDVYIKRCAIGSIQSDSDTLFGVTGYTKSEFDALMIRAYYAEHSTKSGNNLTALLDQSPTGSNTSVPSGAPQYNNDDGEYYSFSGSNQFTIFAATADILALTQGTIWVVAKKDTSVNNTCYFLCASTVGTANKMIGFGMQQGGTLNNSIQTTNCHAGTGSGVFQSYGSDAVDTDWHIFCYQFSNETCGQLFIDGKKQPYNWISPSPSGDDIKFNRSGSFFNKLTSIGRISIGRLSQAVNTDFDFKGRCWFIQPGPCTLEQFRKGHKYLSDRYSITLDDSAIQ